MDEKRNLTNDMVSIDIGRLLKAVWKKAWLVALVAILCAAASLLVTITLISPKYESSVMFYVNNRSTAANGGASISSSDISVSKSLVDTYIVILESRTCLNDIIDHAELDYDMDELKGMINASSMNATEVFEVTVTDTDAKRAQKIANAIADILPGRLTEIVEGTSVEVIDYADKPLNPSSPSNAKNTVIGFLLGALLAAGLIVCIELFNTTIRSEEDVAQSCDQPILASIPDMMAHSKGGGYYRRDDKSNNKSRATVAASNTKNKILIGDGISFAASEAFKLLRTKINFSFADDGKCKVIGVTSSFAGEGKSLSSTNLAHSLAQLDKRVLLIDCDMRRPTLASKLRIRKMPGLSNYLSTRIEIAEILQPCGPKFESAEFNVISAGPNPPNPIELLGSVKMEQMLNSLRENYDYIILDLPPVGEVSDALVASKFTDGILIVVRQGHCKRGALTNTVKQFEFLDSRILGIAMNGVSERSGMYGSERAYGKKYYGISK